MYALQYYHKTILDVSCPEILLQGDTFHVRIGGAVVELWRQKRVAAGNLNVPCWVTSSSFQNSQKGSRSFVQLSEKNIPGVSVCGIVPSLFHGFIPRKLVEGKLLVSLCCSNSQARSKCSSALFSLAIETVVSSLCSSLNIWYLDDGTIGGELHEVAKDLKTIFDISPSLGLELNLRKCEIILGKMSCHLLVNPAVLPPAAHLLDQLKLEQPLSSTVGKKSVKVR